MGNQMTALIFQTGGGTSDIPGLPSGEIQRERQRQTVRQRQRQRKNLEFYYQSI